MIRRYPAVPELDLEVPRHPEPPSLGVFARLAWAGIRLRDDGLTLVARVPAKVAASPAWPELDRLLARYSPWLADLAVVMTMARERWKPEALEARLKSVVPPLADAAWELAGGRRRFHELLRRPLGGARLDLAAAIVAQLMQIEGVIGPVKAAGRGEDDPAARPPARVLRFPSEGTEERPLEGGLRAGR